MANGQRVGYLLWPHANERKVLCDAAEKRKKSWENSVGEAVRFPFPREQDVCHVSGAAVPVIFQTLPANRKKKQMTLISSAWPSSGSWPKYGGKKGTWFTLKTISKSVILGTFLPIVLNWKFEIHITKLYIKRFKWLKKWDVLSYPQQFLLSI